MTLTTISQLFKKYAFVVLGLIVITILLGVVLTQYFTNKNQKEPSLNLQSLKPPLYNTIALNASTFDISAVQNEKTHPKELPVFIKSASQNLVQFQDQLTKTVQLNGESKAITDINLGEGSLVTGTNGVLQIFSDYFVYQKTGRGTNIVPPNFPAKEELISKSESFFTTPPLSLPAQKVIETSYNHFTAHDSYEDENPQNASLVNIKFIPLLEGYKVLLPQKETIATFNKTGDLTSASFASFAQPTPTDNYPIIDAKTAVTLLAQNGHLIEVYGPGLLVLRAKKSLETVYIKKAYLGYYWGDNSQTTTQPMWVFEGESQVEKQSIRAVYVVPAIQSQYYSNP